MKSQSEEISDRYSSHECAEKIATTKIIIKNFRLEMFIGVHEFEKHKAQPVIVSVELSVENNPSWKKDIIDDVLNYESIVTAIQFIARRGHINLLETFAGYILDFCLKDSLVKSAKVLVEKPDIFPSADSVAVEIFKSKID